MFALPAELSVLKYLVQENLKYISFPGRKRRNFRKLNAALKTILGPH